MLLASPPSISLTLNYVLSYTVDEEPKIEMGKDLALPKLFE